MAIYCDNKGEKAPYHSKINFIIFKIIEKLFYPCCKLSENFTVNQFEDKSQQSNKD